MKLSFVLLPTLSLGSADGLAGFPLQEAKDFAQMASLAYCDDNVEDWSCSRCKDSHLQVVPGKVKVVDGGWDSATQFVAARLANQPGCLVSFRGSKTIENWVRNLEFLPTDATAFPHCSGCKVHSGFYTVYEKIYPEVRATMHDIGCQIGSNDQLYITGHSLGGAVATFAAFDLSVLGFKVEKVYTFEAPRVGNKVFADAFNKQFGPIPNYRVTHDHDPVVHLPFENFGFYHVDTEVYFDASGSNYKVCNGGEDPTCADKNGNVADDLLFHVNEHCENSAFGSGFNFCGQGCGKATTSDVVV